MLCYVMLCYVMLCYVMRFGLLFVLCLDYGAFNVVPVCRNGKLCMVDGEPDYL